MPSISIPQKRVRECGMFTGVSIAIARDVKNLMGTTGRIQCSGVGRLYFVNIDVLQKKGKRRINKRNGSLHC